MKKIYQVQQNVLFSSFQEYTSNGTAHVESEYERRMMSVFNRVLEEVESLNRKYAPVSYLASNSLNVFSVDEGSKNPSAPYIHTHTHI